MAGFSVAFGSISDRGRLQQTIYAEAGAAQLRIEEILGPRRFTEPSPDYRLKVTYSAMVDGAASSGRSQAQVRPSFHSLPATAGTACSASSTFGYVRRPFVAID
jgi:hypothetical protein